MQIKHKLLITVLLVANYSAYATTIIAVIYRDAIYLASDSKIVYVGQPPQNAPHTVCKISHTAKRAFACSAPTVDYLVRFDLHKTITNLMVSQTTSKQWITQSDEAIRVDMPPLLDHLKRDFPTYYASRLGSILVECAFASWETQPMLIDDVWLLRANGTLQHDPGYPLTISGNNSVVIGARDAIEKRLKNGTPINRGGLTVPGMLEQLITVQIESGSPDPMLGTTVGSPISVLRIDQAGTHWEMQGVCDKP